MKDSYEAWLKLIANEMKIADSGGGDFKIDYFEAILGGRF